MAWLSTHPWVAVGVQITLVFVCYLLSPIDSATVAEAFACQYPYPYIGPFFYRVYFQKQWLPTCGWPTGGMQHLAMAQRPMLLRGDSLPSNAWKAHMRWQSREYIAKTFEPLLGVWQRPLYSPNAKGARHFVYFAERGEAGGRFGMRAPANSPPSSSRVVEHEEMDVDVFLRGSNMSDRMFYCSHDLAALGKRAMKDVEPLTPFGLRGGDTYNSDANNTSATNDPESRKRAATRGIVWLGTGRPVSHAHYDTSHNLFVQVVGKKHFTLWPPGAITQLKYFPTRHSMHRQSTWADPPTDASEMAFDVTLNEGDALYLPPFYAHQVAALTNLSISVAVWSTSDEASRKDALETLPLPWEAEWTRKEVIICAALFLRAVLIGVYGTGRFEAYYAVVNQVKRPTLHVLT